MANRLAFPLGKRAKSFRNRPGRVGTNPPAAGAIHFISCVKRTRLPSRKSQQGRSDSNAQPPVLETGALPIELHPSVNHCRLKIAEFRSGVADQDWTSFPPTLAAGNLQS